MYNEHIRYFSDISAKILAENAQSCASDVRWMDPMKCALGGVHYNFNILEDWLKIDKYFVLKHNNRFADWVIMLREGVARLVSH